MFRYSYNKLFLGPSKFCENVKKNVGAGWQLFSKNAGGEEFI